MSVRLDTHETSDAYHAVVVRLASDWRVVTCKDGIQWIVQRRKNGGAERPWRGVHYCRTRNALVRLCATSCGPLAPETEAVLQALPERMGARA